MEAAGLEAAAKPVAVGSREAGAHPTDCSSHRVRSRTEACMEAAGRLAAVATAAADSWALQRVEEESSRRRWRLRALASVALQAGRKEATAVAMPVCTVRVVVAAALSATAAATATAAVEEVAADSVSAAEVAGLGRSTTAPWTEEETAEMVAAAGSVRPGADLAAARAVAARAAEAAGLARLVAVADSVVVEGVVDICTAQEAAVGLAAAMDKGRVAGPGMRSSPRKRVAA